VGFVRVSAGRLGERVKLTQSGRDMRLRLLWIADIPLSLASFHRTRVQPRVTPTLPAALVSASSVSKGAPRAIGLGGEAPDASQGPQRAIGGRDSGCSGGREADHDRRREFSECPGLLGTAGREDASWPSVGAPSLGACGLAAHPEGRSARTRAPFRRSAQRSG
jgi:hypothetical protein